MIIIALPNDLATAHKNAAMSIVKRGKRCLLETQSEVVVCLHAGNVNLFAFSSTNCCVGAGFDVAERLYGVLYSVCSGFGFTMQMRM